MDERKKELEKNKINADHAVSSSTRKTGGSEVGGNIQVSDRSDFVGGDKYQGFSVNEVTKLLEVFADHIKPSYLKAPEDLDQIFIEFHLIQEKIKEWKELHNYLDSTIQVYGQFQHEVQLSTKKCPNVSELVKSWWNIGLRLDDMLNWAKTINYIGTRYASENNSLMGEPWAVILETTRSDINKHLEIGEESLKKSGSVFDNILGNETAETWCKDLKNLSSKYYSTVLFYMHSADDNLRKCIEQLSIISNKFLVG